MRIPNTHEQGITSQKLSVKYELLKISNFQQKTQGSKDVLGCTHNIVF
jgi:hypothetical protein